MNLSQLKNEREASVEDNYIETNAIETIKVPERQTEVKKHRTIFSYIWAHKIISLILMGAAFFSGFYYVKLTQIRQTGLNIGVLDPFKGAINAIKPQPKPESVLAKLDKTNGKTNILLIGVDARSYNESYLTDSIMVMSYDHAKKETAQISLPRDLNVKAQINPQWHYEGKVNAVFPFTYNDQMQKTKDQKQAFDKAFIALGKSIQDITNLPIHYGVLINFKGFQEIIDTLGGITVDVETSFTDYEFPRNDDKGYITISFKAGKQDMNGDKALQYARSRHGNNGEGSDYMRARRQQKVIAAIKDKITSSNIVTKVDTLNQLVTTLGNNIRFYNIGGDELDIAVRARDSLKDNSIYSMVLDPEFGGVQGALLTGQNIDARGFIVVPKNNKYDKVQATIDFYMQNSFLLKEKAKVLVAWTNPKRFKAFGDVKEILGESKMAFDTNEPQIRVTPNTTGTPSPTVTPSGTATTFPITIYQLSEGKDKSLEYYKDLLTKEAFAPTIKTKTELPTELEKIASGQDFLIVLE